MTTYDVSLSGTAWVAIVPTGTFIKVVLQTEEYQGKLVCRFGIASTSYGFEISHGDIVECSETLYVRLPQNYYDQTVKLVVSGD